MTSSARASSVGGTSRPSTFAVNWGIQRPTSRRAARGLTGRTTGAVGSLSDRVPNALMARTRTGRVTSPLLGDDAGSEFRSDSRALRSSGHNAFAFRKRIRVNGTIFCIGRRGLSGRPLLVSFAPSDRPSSVPSRSSTLSATSSDRRCIAMRSKRPLIPRAVAREAIATMDCYLQYWRNNRTKWDSSLQEGTWFFHFTSACSDGSPN
jgi:hypothetical protein